MRTSKTLFISIVLILAVFLTACGTAVAQERQPVVRTLTVNGSAQAYLDPDTAFITIGVHTEGTDAAVAVEENNQQAQAVIETLLAQGIAEKDIRTNNFSIYPMYQYTPDGQRGDLTYSVDNTVHVTLRDLEIVGELLDAVVSSGANNISGIQFDVENKEAALAQARKDAVGNARQLAEEMAEAAGDLLVCGTGGDQCENFRLSCGQQVWLHLIHLGIFAPASLLQDALGQNFPGNPQLI